MDCLLTLSPGDLTVDHGELLAGSRVVYTASVTLPYIYTLAFLTFIVYFNQLNIVPESKLPTVE